MLEVGHINGHFSIMSDTMEEMGGRGKQQECALTNREEYSQKFIDRHQTGCLAGGINSLCVCVLTRQGSRLE